MNRRTETPRHPADACCVPASQRARFERQGLLWSTLIHLGVLALVTLCFRLTPVAFKPSFVFLGPILGPDELARGTAAFGGEPLRLGYPSAVLAEGPRAVLSAPGPGENRKAPFVRSIASGDKVYRQVTFLDGPDQAEQRRKLLIQIGVNPDHPARIPLRLDP